MTSVGCIQGDERELRLCMFKDGQRVRDEEAINQFLSAAHSCMPCLSDGHNGWFLSNGARLYKDAPCSLEWASPEVTNPRDQIVWDLAMREILRIIAAEVMARDTTVTGISVYLSNVCYARGTSSGSHESYLHYRSGRTVGTRVIDHLATRVIYTGVGGLTSSCGGVEFSLSPRSDFIAKLMGEAHESERDRPMYHAKDEPLATTSGSERLHVLVGETHCSQLSGSLKYASTSIAVRLADLGMLPLEERYRLASPLDAFHRFATDPTCTATAPTVSGSEISAIEYQRRLLDAARKNLARMPNWAPEFIRVWQDVLDKLEFMPFRLDNALDWRIKRRLFAEHLAARGLSWNSPPGELAALRSELAMIDLEYGEIITGGIFGDLDDAGVLTHRVVDDPGAVARAIGNPPTGTRAWARGQAVRALYSSSIKGTADWMSVSDPVNNTRLDLSDPFQTAVEWEELKSDEE